MNERPIDYVGVVRYQRYVMLCVLALVMAWLLRLGFVIRGFSGASRVPEWVFTASALLQWPIALAAMVMVILLMVAQRRNAVVLVLLSLLMLVPFINLLVLLHVNSTATMMLKARGAKVGLMGVPQHEVARLLPGRCAGCGYDRAGLEVLAACPECGRVPEVR